MTMLKYVYMFDLPLNERHCDRVAKSEKDRRGIDRLSFIGSRLVELVLPKEGQDGLVERCVVGGRIPVYLDTCQNRAITWARKHPKRILTHRMCIGSHTSCHLNYYLQYTPLLTI